MALFLIPVVSLPELSKKNRNSPIYVCESHPSRQMGWHSFSSPLCRAYLRIALVRCGHYSGGFNRCEDASVDCRDLISTNNFQSQSATRPPGLQSPAAASTNLTPHINLVVSSCGSCMKPIIDVPLTLGKQVRSVAFLVQNHNPQEPRLILENLEAAAGAFQVACGSASKAFPDNSVAIVVPCRISYGHYTP
ncbi:hypothetical protein DEU56DRAFT_423973 [Suillus clintonianus]|uniref:uncharacterized protein n=1 Tax=Suillus clintonianus TaxID=1904413 RepID=UPI001B861150|nr:uncharacterized protein DEU56DRAFT_423973 [Suillus clintonianus]KAG2133016.1 hypothetical protein DEU56DRAFT_423973 [Suillus clintonianus]